MGYASVLHNVLIKVIENVQSIVFFILFCDQRCFGFYSAFGKFKVELQAQAILELLRRGRG